MNESRHSTTFESFAPQQNEAPPESTGQKVARTVREGIALLILAQIVAVVLTQLKANFFLQSQAQTQGVGRLLGNPLMLVVLAVVLAPILEELIFRGIPSGLMRLTTRPESSMRSGVWIVFGLASSFLFAAMHGVKMVGIAPNQSLAFQTLPVPQLLVGLWAWHVATLRGLRYSMLLHAVFNGVLVGLALLAIALGVKI